MQRNSRGFFGLPDKDRKEIRCRIGEEGLHLLDFFMANAAVLKKRSFPTKEALLSIRIRDAAADDYKLKLMISAADRGDPFAYEAVSRLTENLHADGDLPPLLQDFVVRDWRRLRESENRTTLRKGRTAERDSLIRSAMHLLVNCYGYGKPSRRGKPNRRSIEAAAGLVADALAELERLGFKDIGCSGEKIQKLWCEDRFRCSEAQGNYSTPVVTA